MTPSEHHPDALQTLDLEFEVVKRTVKAFRDLLADYLEGHGEILASAQEIDRMEKESDRLERHLEIQLLESEQPTAWIAECVHLSDAVDKIANKVEDASDFMVLTRPRIPPMLLEPLVRITDVTVEAYAMLEEAWKAYRQDPTRVTDATHQVSDLEQKIDGFLWDATRDVFSSDLELAEKLHLKSLLDQVCFISNRIEEAAQVTEVLAIREQGRRTSEP